MLLDNVSIWAKWDNVQCHWETMKYLPGHGVFVFSIKEYLREDTHMNIMPDFVCKLCRFLLMRNKILSRSLYLNCLESL